MIFKKQRYLSQKEITKIVLGKLTEEKLSKRKVDVGLFEALIVSYSEKFYWTDKKRKEFVLCIEYISNCSGQLTEMGFNKFLSNNDVSYVDSLSHVDTFCFIARICNLVIGHPCITWSTWRTSGHSKNGLQTNKHSGFKSILNTKLTDKSIKDILLMPQQEAIIELNRYYRLCIKHESSYSKKPSNVLKTVWTCINSMHKTTIGTIIIILITGIALSHYSTFTSSETPERTQEQDGEMSYMSVKEEKTDVMNICQEQTHPRSQIKSGRCEKTGSNQ